jgi:hypothetical protein
MERLAGLSGLGAGPAGWIRRPALLGALTLAVAMTTGLATASGADQEALEAPAETAADAGPAS